MRLTTIEIEALLAAAGNVDPAMFEDEPDKKLGDRLRTAWKTGQEKLRIEFGKRQRNTSKKVNP